MTSQIILTGDCLEQMRMYVGDGEIQTCVTSPPYFGLRDYGTASWEGGDASCDHKQVTSAGTQTYNYKNSCGKCGAVRVDEQIGLESTPDEYVAKLVEVFREVRRCLADDGTLWLNLGDSYAGSGRGGNPEDSAHQKQQSNRGSRQFTQGSVLPAGLHEVARQAGNIGRAWVPPPAGFKQKDLMGIPWMVAFALRADGWYLRQDIIWNKPNPMPESIKDRCTKAHEYIFLLSKSKKYYFNGDAIATPVKETTRDRLTQQNLEAQAGSDRVPGKTSGPMKACFGGRNKHEGYGTRIHSGNEDEGNYLERGANRRSVWTVTTKPFKGAHFATFPPEIPELCILAGSRLGDTVLDPFGGAGTTALVANRLGRSSILCELNPEYVAMAEARLKKEQE